MIIYNNTTRKLENTTIDNFFCYNFCSLDATNRSVGTPKSNLILLGKNYINM